LRILHVIHTLNRATGGPPEGLRQIALGYTKIGVTIEVLCLDNPEAPFVRDAGFIVHPLGDISSAFAYSPKMLPWLRENIHRFDGIVVHGIWQWTNVAVRLAAKGKKPFGVFTHGAMDPWFKRNYPLKHLKKVLYWPLQYDVFRNAVAVFFTTDTEAELARESFWPNRWNSVVVPYGTNQPDGDPKAQKEAFLSAFPELRERRYFLFLARIHEKKGCDLLLQAFASIASRYPDIDLVIAGPDQVGLQAKLMAAAVSRRIQQRVHWPGLLQGDTKWGAFYGAEAFILPSHQENFGIVVAEALACGLPVLISNQVNIWKDIVADRTGFVEDDTAEGTLRLMEKWLSISEQEQRDMAERCLPSFLRRYSMKEAAKALARIFSS